MQVGLRRCFPTLRVLSLWKSLAGDALEAERVEHCTVLKGIPGLHVDSGSGFVSCLSWPHKDIPCLSLENWEAETCTLGKSQCSASP